ncbi:DUF4446 family protein [Clostridium sp. JN-9]|uniref:DUF4446 family protein n=1 Tax=Clostridium sp. JN-9 TaxID=2507159 RepID=UPI000FFE0C49|nr:DUF4446 family protein [Clostridium sp. JN-9]QAT41552.1 DUF4446 family protein [Clostridium sp. JN-9]
MDNLIKTFNNFQPYLILALVIVVIIMILMIIILFNALGKLERKYKKFMRGTDNKNIEELILKYFDNIDKVKEDTEDVKELYKSLNQKVENCIQKVSLIRYRAFEDVGSDLSFSIAILDSKNNGFILTGIYGRNESTTYAKPIDEGLSRYELSQEEKQVLLDAMSK